MNCCSIISRSLVRDKYNSCARAVVGIVKCNMCQWGFTVSKEIPCDTVLMLDNVFLWYTVNMD